MLLPVFFLVTVKSPVVFGAPVFSSWRTGAGVSQIKAVGVQVAVVDPYELSTVAPDFRP